MIRFTLRLCLLVITLTMGLQSYGQNKDSLHRELRKATSVIKKAKILNQLVDAWGVTELDSAEVYLEKEIQLLVAYNKKNGSEKEPDLLLADAYMKKSYILTTYDQNSEAIKMLLRALRMVKKHHELEVMTGLSHNLAYAYNSNGMLDSALYYYGLAAGYSEKRKDTAAMARSYTSLAVTQVSLGNYTIAEKHLKRAIAYYHAVNDNENVFGAYITAAQMYDAMGNVKSSLQYYRKAMAAAEKTGDKYQLCAVYNDLGLYYAFLHNDEEALRHFRKALNYALQLKSLRQRELCYSNLAGYYENRKQYDSVRHYLNKSRVLLSQIEIPERVARNRNQEAAILIHEKKYRQAIDTLLLSVKAFDEMGEQHGKITTRVDLAECYLKSGNTASALEWALQARAMDKDSRDIYNRRDIHRILASIYEKQGNTALALENIKVYNKLRDSVMNMENVRELAANQFKYTYEKKQYADSVRFAQKENQRKLVLAQKNAQIAQEKTQRYALYGGLALVLVFSIFIFNRFRLTNKQKKIIEEQKLLVEEKQREVMDSIKYARRIQDALLKEENRAENLPEHFIFYRPKDIVSGDFHWILEKDGYVYIAAADCTGHGVPGAFLTMLGTSYLNEITSNAHALRPADILNQLRDKFIRELSQRGKEGESKDGMDIALCAIQFRISNFESANNSKSEIRNSKFETDDLKSQISNIELAYAGANNPLWLVRNGELIEIKADKQPIGYHDKPMPFTHHELQLSKGDTLYIFTDGFQDQFGGDKGKKFKAAGMKNLFLQWTNLSMQQQQEQMQIVFDTWKRGFEQIDDVCVIGIRV